jgi:hypothetical protein
MPLRWHCGCYLEEAKEERLLYYGNSIIFYG